MKTSFLIIIIILFSLISGWIWALSVLHFSHSLPWSMVDNLLWTNNSIWGEKAQEGNNTMAESFQNIVTSTVENVSSSVVSIVIKKDLVIYRRDPWGFFAQPTGTVSREVWGGSGFFIDVSWTILTNKHVVSDMDAEYTVILNDGSEYDAQVIALDPINDLAVIQVTSSNTSFSPLPLISSTDDIEVWEFGIAVWNALSEFQNSVSLGIVSGKDRSIEAEWDSLSGLIQTDAAINPGNSWWPLLDLEGRVMGINTAIASGANGVGFSIALTQDRVDYMLESIKEHGRIKRPFIGINYIQNSVGIASELWLPVDYWAYIVDEPGSIVTWSSAEKAGLKSWDIILEINNSRIEGQMSLGNIIQNSIPGDQLNLKVLKKSWEEMNIQLELWEF